MVGVRSDLGRRSKAGKSYKGEQAAHIDFSDSSTNIGKVRSVCWDGRSLVASKLVSNSKFSRVHETHEESSQDPQDRGYRHHSRVDGLQLQSRR